MIRPAFRLAACLLFAAASASASLADHPAPPPVVPPSAASAPAASAPAPSAPPANGSPPAASAQPSGEREAILALARNGLLDSAHSLCLQALVRKPDDAFLLLMVGKLGSSGKESAEAFKKAAKSGGHGPEAEESLFRLGQYTYAAGKYHLAIPFFRDYLREYPEGDWKQPTLYWIGNASLALSGSRPDRTNYLDSAAAWFGRLLADTKPIDYYHPLALEGVAKAKAAKGDREGAWQTVLSALDQAPEEERPALLLLAAQVRQGVDRDTEKSLMMQLMSKYPQAPETRYLRKLNGAADTSKWKSGSGLPRTAAAGRDTSATATATVKTDSVKAAAAFELPKAEAHPPAAQAEAGKPAQAPGLAYTLQCGAFTQVANAQAMMASLAKLALSPELVERDRGGKRIYQVRVGRFASVEDAEAFARANLKPQRVLSQPVPVAP